MINEAGTFKYKNTIFTTVVHLLASFMALVRSCTVKP